MKKALAWLGAGLVIALSGIVPVAWPQSGKVPDAKAAGEGVTE